MGDFRFIRTRMALAVVLGGLFSAGPALATGQVCITGDIGLDGVAPGTCYAPSDLEPLLDKPLARGPNSEGGKMTMTHPDDFKRKETVSTCRAYEEKLAADWYAMSSADMAAEGWFERTCGTLRVLIGADGSEKSLLEDPDKGLSDPGLISAQVLPLQAEVKRAEIARLLKPGATVGDLVKAGAVRLHAARKGHLDLTFRDQRAIYDEIARGDFNRDGLADVLLFMGVHHEGGTLAWYDHLALSRTRPAAILEVVLNAD